MKPVPRLDRLRGLGAILCIFCTASAAVETDGLQSLANTDHHVVHSTSAGRSYNVYVGLPDDYAQDDGRHYPTVYVLDGGELYPLFVSYAHYIRSDEDIPGLIVVGISYGTRDWENGNDRSHDFTAPSDEREFWGGAADFQKFLATELVPLIEDSYRSRADRRIVFGQSLGGQFVLHAAQTDPGLFWGHIASNPALHRNLEFFLDRRANGPRVPGRPRLFVSSGSRDEPQFREPALQWMSHWTSVENPPWELEAVTLEGHGHFSAAPAAFRRGLIWLFSAD